MINLIIVMPELRIEKQLEKFHAWIDKLEVTNASLVYTANLDRFKLNEIDNYVRFAAGVKVVTLGGSPSKVLKKYNIPHYKLPHPRTNKSVDNELKKCYDWLRS